MGGAREETDAGKTLCNTADSGTEIFSVLQSVKIICPANWAGIVLAKAKC